MSVGQVSMKKLTTHLNEHHPVGAVGQQPVIDVGYKLGVARESAKSKRCLNHGLEYTDTEVAIQIYPRVFKFPRHLAMHTLKSKFSNVQKFIVLNYAPCDIIITRSKRCVPSFPALSYRIFNISCVVQTWTEWLNETVPPSPLVNS